MPLASEAPWTCDWALPAQDVLQAVATAANGDAETALANLLGCPPSSLVLGAGISELVLALGSVLLQSPDRLVLPAAHPWRRLLRGGVGIPHRTNGHLDLARVFDAPQAAQDLLLVGSPDPMTGCSLTMPELSLLLDGCPGTLVLDGTYHEFAPAAWLPAVLHHDRLVLVRPVTLLTQAVPIAYAVAPPAIAAQLRDVLPPLSPFLQAVTNAWVGLAPRWQDLAQGIVAERQRLYRALLRTPGVEVLASRANFLTVRGSQALGQSLAAAGIPVRQLGMGGDLQDIWQLPVGDGAANEAVMARLADAALTSA